MSLFLGLDVRIKVETTPIIQELHAANLRTIMVTGDNINTALSVAKECKIVENGRIIVVSAVRNEQGKLEPHFMVNDTLRSDSKTTAVIDMEKR